MNGVTRRRAALGDGDDLARLVVRRGEVRRDEARAAGQGGVRLGGVVGPGLYALRALASIE